MIRREAAAPVLACVLGCALLFPEVPAPAAAAVQRPAGGRVVGWGDPGLLPLPAGLTDVTAVATSGSHALALRADGTVVGWGDDSDGEASIPPRLGKVAAIAAGPGFSLAVLAGGTVVGWGRAAPRHRLHPPPGLERVVAVAAGDNHALALRSDGTVVGWGSDRDGQISVPAGLSGVVAVAAGGFFSVALRAGGTLVTWGYDVQLGDVLVYPSPDGASSPTNPVRQVHGGYYTALNAASATGALGRFRAIDAEYDHSLALATNGTVRANGSRYNLGSDVPAGLTDVVAVATGTHHHLALRSDGTVAAWGGRRDPDTGIPSDEAGATRVPPGLDDVIALAAGGSFNLAITTARPVRRDRDHLG